MSKNIILNDNSITEDSFCDKLGYSRSVIYKRLMKICYLNIVKFINTIKVEEALKHILSGKLNISEAAHEVVFTT